MKVFLRGGGERFDLICFSFCSMTTSQPSSSPSPVDKKRKYHDEGDVGVLESPATQQRRKLRFNPVGVTRGLIQSLNGRMFMLANATYVSTLDVKLTPLQNATRFMKMLASDPACLEVDFTGTRKHSIEIAPRLNGHLRLFGMFQINLQDLNVVERKAIGLLMFYSRHMFGQIKEVAQASQCRFTQYRFNAEVERCLDRALILRHFFNGFMEAWVEQRFFFSHFLMQSAMCEVKNWLLGWHGYARPVPETTVPAQRRDAIIGVIDELTRLWKQYLYLQIRHQKRVRSIAYMKQQQQQQEQQQKSKE